MIRRRLWRVALLLACFVPLTAVAALAEKKVMIITSRGCEEVCKSFQLNLESQGAVAFLMRDTGNDMQRIAGFVKEARALRTDLVATWGTGVTQAVVGKIGEVDKNRHLTDIPVVYMYVGNPVESRIAAGLDKSGRPNLAGANTAVPIEAQINLIASYSTIHRIGMLYNANEPAAAAQAVSVRKAFEARSIPVVSVELVLGADGQPDPHGIDPALHQLARQKPDFLFQIGSNFMLKNIETISKGAIARGIPMFSPFESAFRRGEVLLGLISPLNGVGQIAAYQAGQILFHGQAPGSLSSPTLSRYSVLINMRVARALKNYPPMKLLQFAEVTQ
jgi:putative tryptophan/tyrosine transport system substrate-binding protein